MSRLLLLLFLGCVIGGCSPANNHADTHFTLILAGGTVYDGLGNAPLVTDVGLVGNRIVAIGDLAQAPADQRIDVSGLAVAPGFIDIHSHAASFQPAASGIVQRPLAENYLRQGVTTVLGGQDGSSPFPIGPYLDAVAATPPAINFGVFVGHGTLRSIAMGNEARSPTSEELAQMRDMVTEALQDGAFGLSSGLEYAPGMFAETDELIALAEAIAPFGGLYISHIRDEGGRLLESVEEVIRIGEAAGIPAQVTHHKVIGKHRWGRSTESLRLLDEARARGVDVMSDQYPYTASSTGISILLPGWSKEGTSEEIQARFNTPATGQQIRAEVIAHINEERGGDPATIVVANCAWDTSLNGMSLADILESRGLRVDVPNAAELAMELYMRGNCQGVFHSMSEEDVIRIMQHPMTMISSDGGIPNPGVGVPHPRNYGSFARVLGHYVREKQALPLEEAVRKMTSLPAQRLGLADRGVLRPEALADVTVFDPATITDHATFTDPHQYASGVVHVFVAGQAVLADGKPTNNRPGHVLRKGQ